MPIRLFRVNAVAARSNHSNDRHNSNKDQIEADNRRAVGLEFAMHAVAVQVGEIIPKIFSIRDWHA